MFWRQQLLMLCTGFSIISALLFHRAVKVENTSYKLGVQNLRDVMHLLFLVNSHESL